MRFPGGKMRTLSKFFECPLTPAVRKAVTLGNKEALSALKLKEASSPRVLVKAIDKFVYDWQGGKRAKSKAFDTLDDIPVALGCLWGTQLIRQFDWEWVLIRPRKTRLDPRLAIVSPDRSLCIWPIEFITDAMEFDTIDVTIALSFNMLREGLPKPFTAKTYTDLMDKVERLVPRR
jgi:hypothetical protein